MPTLTGVYLFLLGLACGLVILTMTAYRRVSPSWLRWLLIAAGGLMVGRYVTLALFTAPEAPERFWALRHCWFASAIGLALPSVVAVDQLVKHPAMTPRRLLLYLAPFLAAATAVMLFGTYAAHPDPLVGWTLRLGPAWRALIAVSQGVFVVGFIGVSLMIMRKFPSRPTRLALLGLVAGYVYLGIDGLVLALGGSYFRPYLYSEMLTLIAIWYAYETGATLHQTG